MLSLLVVTPLLGYLLINAVRSAPEGYEDETGFHPVPEPVRVRQETVVALKEHQI